MNSIFQQLYHTFPFRYRITTPEFTDPSQQALQKLFAEMEFNIKKAVDTEPIPFLLLSSNNKTKITLISKRIKMKIKIKLIKVIILKRINQMKNGYVLMMV